MVAIGVEKGLYDCWLQLMIDFLRLMALRDTHPICLALKISVLQIASQTVPVGATGSDWWHLRHSLSLNEKSGLLCLVPHPGQRGGCHRTNCFFLAHSWIGCSKYLLTAISCSSLTSFISPGNCHGLIKQLEFLAHQESLCSFILYATQLRWKLYPAWYYQMSK